MVTRTRTRNVSLGTGTRTHATLGLTGTTNPSRYEECIDIVDGTRNPHTLTISKTCPVRFFVDGANRLSGSSKTTYVHYANTAGGSDAHASPQNVEPSDNVTLSSTLARTNPSRPSVDLPVFAYELKDIPDLVKSRWDAVARTSKRSFLDPRRKSDLRDLPKDVAEDYLEWNFAIAPLISDVAKMINFVQGVEKKLNMLRNLADRGHAGGYAVVYDDWVESALITQYVSGGYQEFRQASFNVGTSRRKWGTTVWIPTVPVPRRTRKESLDLAVRLTFGLDFSFSTMWEAMPWSWFIDWFSNLGDIFAGNRNTVPVRHDGSCVMKHTRTKVTNLALVPHATPGTLSVHGTDFLRETKTRVVVGSALPLPEFDLPLLSGRQLGILASLIAAQKAPTS